MWLLNTYLINMIGIMTGNLNQGHIMQVIA
jgi:hypothetical protein